ncbi:hypothetical protein ANCCEY_01385 [Ancylostoma ceylanicum]|uniref:Uncharacterized protein n=1 Tax=Ancylostoma ceylanicum TaxID=53326 RepID=A0A0D6M609_9BILA|nr:hypothetical protein ANCCEY_01385 [Ancylostoma ceylanicum]
MLSVNDVLSRNIWRQDSKSDLPVKVNEAYDRWHECISGALLSKLDDQEQLWPAFADAVNTCYDRTPMKNVNLSGVSNKDEYKFHIFNDTDIAGSRWDEGTISVGSMNLTSGDINVIIPRRHQKQNF